MRAESGCTYSYKLIASVALEVCSRSSSKYALQQQSVYTAKKSERRGQNLYYLPVLLLLAAVSYHSMLRNFAHVKSWCS